MTAKNESAPFLVLISLISALAVAMFAAGAFLNTGIIAMGFVLIFTALVGWTAYVGVRSGSMRRLGEASESPNDEQPAEKASCATTLSA